MANQIEDQSKGDLAHVILPALAAGSDLCFEFRLVQSLFADCNFTTGNFYRCCQLVICFIVYPSYSTSSRSASTPPTPPSRIRCTTTTTPTPPIGRNARSSNGFGAATGGQQNGGKFTKEYLRLWIPEGRV